MAIRRDEIFSRSLTDTDIKFRLAVPLAKVEQFGSIPERHHSLDFEALDMDGHPWCFCLSTRTEGPYLKPVLKGKGWCAYVRAKNLKEGDVITFYKETYGANRITFRIEATKTMLRLFGKEITFVV